MDFKDAQKIVGFCEGARPQGDFYATPTAAITQLLDKEQFGNTVLEPCCGNGAISKILQVYKYNVISQDLYDWGYGISGKDFLTETTQDVDAVITNPPFKLSTEFVYKALECTKLKQGKVAILNRVQWLEGQKRRKLFTGTCLSKVLVFSKRIPRFNRYDFVGKQGTSLIFFAWFKWDWQYAGEPQIGWF